MSLKMAAASGHEQTILIADLQQTVQMLEEQLASLQAERDQAVAGISTQAEVSPTAKGPGRQPNTPACWRT